MLPDSKASPLFDRLRGAIPPAFQYPKFRAFWFGMLASVIGYQVLQFTQLWLMYQITGSALSLGYVGLANAVPGIVLNLFGGVYADRLDQRRLIIIAQLVTSALVFLLATLTLLDLVRQWHILAIAFSVGAVEAFNQPARQSLYPHLIDRSVLVSAIALNSSVWQGTRIVAPAVAGVVVALVGSAASFYLAGLGSVVMALVIFFLKMPPISRDSRSSAVRGMWEGLSFIWRNPVFAFLIGMTFINSFFGMSYIIMMPVFAEDILKVGAEGQGMLVSVSGIAALATSLWFGSRRRASHQGFLMIAGAVLFGGLVAAFAITSSLVGSFPLALGLLFFTGFANSTYMINVQGLLHSLVPDRMRGRVMGFFGMTWSVMPLGGLQAGALATVVTVPIAVAIGGIAVAAFAIGPALLNPRVRNVDALLAQRDADLAAPTPTRSPE